MRIPTENNLTDEQLPTWYKNDYAKIKEANPDADEATLVAELRKHLRGEHRTLLGPA